MDIVTDYFLPLDKIVPLKEVSKIQRGTLKALLKLQRRVGPIYALFFDHEKFSDAYVNVEPNEFHSNFSSYHKMRAKLADPGTKVVCAVTVQRIIEVPVVGGSVHRIYPSSTIYDTGGVYYARIGWSSLGFHNKQCGLLITRNCMPVHFVFKVEVGDVASLR